MDETKDLKYIEVGERIASLRRELKLTQQELANVVGYETSTAISLIESGKRRIQLVELEDLARQLHTSVNYLLTGKEFATDIRTVLRADKNLSRSDIQQVADYIGFIKNQRNNKVDGR